MKEPASINRNVVLVIPKRPFYDWENRIFPDFPSSEEDVKEHNSYLISGNRTFEDPKKELSKYWKYIFENELFGICTDESMWSKKLTWELFNEWFEFHFSSIVLDLENKPLELLRFE